MTKSRITKIWIVGLIVFVAGLLASGAGLGLLLTFGGEFSLVAGGSDYTFVPHLDGAFWTTTGVLLVASVVILAGLVLQLVAWIGALVSTYHLPDKAWFVVLLVGGLLGLVSGLAGFAAMVAYVIAGPDDVAERHREAAPAQSGAESFAPTI